MRARSALLLWIALSALTRAAVAADGLAPPDGHAVWPQWQARLTVNSTVLAPVSLTERAEAANAPRTTIPSTALFGDYYFDAPGLRLPATVGGLRATSGLVTSTRAQPQGPSDTVPYLGVGYTGLAVKGRWGFTADLGLTVENASSAGQIGRALFGNQGFDNALRELRLSPVLQVGVRYAF